jgi:hypothetical protein
MVSFEEVSELMDVEGRTVRIANEARGTRAVAIAQVNGVQIEAPVKVKRQFMEDLASFSSSAKLAEVPLKLRLFNLTEDHLQYPSLDGKKVKKGWLSSFKQSVDV